MTSLLDPLLNPILNMVPAESSMGPFYLIISFSLLISLLTTIVYKFVTNQDLMRSLKHELKELQKEMKTLKDNPERMMEVQKKSMETNMKYMTQSFKPTLITLIPIIIIFGWMSAHLAYYPIMSDSNFVVGINVDDELINQNVSIEVPEGITLISEKSQTINSNNIEWTLKGKEGDYSLLFKVNNKTYEKEVIISNTFGYFSEIDSKIKEDSVNSIYISNKPVKPLKNIGLGFIPWIGGFGWLGCYILFSIIFSIIIRKLLRVV